MEPAKRMIVNTGVQYAKAIITTCLALYSTRLVLEVLSVSDYGIYSVIAGVVAMLGFITNALIITTQRYLSFYRATESTEFLRRLFANSLFIHLAIGLVITVILLLLEGVLFDAVLSIDPVRIPTAKRVYVITVIMLFLAVYTTPFKALFIAHENIVFISLVEIVDSIVKLLMVIGLSYVVWDKLLAYAALMAFILVLNLVAFVVYGLVRFPECGVAIHLKDLSKEYIQKMLGFAGWTTYGMGCVATRNQGTAIVLNHFFMSTVVNAAYGIAIQVNGAISFLVTSILNAMNPQLMQAEGQGDRGKMMLMAARQSKFSVAILAVVVIPLIVEMPSVLSLWLKEVPEHTGLFCRTFLLAFVCDQLTLGLSSANQAMGRIRAFTLLTYTPKMLYVAVAWCLLHVGYDVRVVMVVYVLVELSVALVRIPYMRCKAGLDTIDYFRSVIVPSVGLCIVLFLVCGLFASHVYVPYRFVLTGALSVLTGAATGWLLMLNPSEKEYLLNLLRTQMKR